MRRRDVAEVLWAVAADLQWVGDRVWEDPARNDPLHLLAGVTRTEDEFSRDVAAIHEAITLTLALLGQRPSPVGEVVRLHPRP